MYNIGCKSIVTLFSVGFIDIILDMYTKNHFMLLLYTASCHLLYYIPYILCTLYITNKYTTLYQLKRFCWIDGVLTWFTATYKLWSMNVEIILI